MKSVLRHSPFIDADTLQACLTSGHKVTVLDARFDLATADAATLRQVDWIPDAIHVDLTAEAASAPGPESGRLPLPEVSDLQRDARRWGIDDDTKVTIYDEGKGSLAARLWWVLQWAGVKDVYILDGGLSAWRAAGFPTSRQLGPVRRGAITLKAGHLASITAEEALEAGREGALIDARARDAYEGYAGQPATGHIPGAFSIPVGALQSANGKVKPATEILEALRATGAVTDKVIAAYCGSGVAAAYAVAAFRSAGVQAALYAGSWTEWIKNPARPTTQGASRF